VAGNGSAVVGQARIRSYYAELFAILIQSQAIIGDVTRQTRVEHVVPWGDGAWAVGRGVNTASGADAPVTTTDHWIAIFARSGSDWKIRAFSVGEDAPRTSPAN